jgi:hypothetical protein
MRLMSQPHTVGTSLAEPDSNTALSFDAWVYTGTMAYFALAARSHNVTEVTMELAFAAATVRLDSFNRLSSPPGTAFVTG